MKRLLVTLFSVLLTCTGLVALTSSSSQADDHDNGVEKITICHVAGLAEDPANTVTLHLPLQALVEAGHLNENGTLAAGHEQDTFGPCPVAPPPVECPDGDFNGEAPGCGEAPPECPDGDFNGDEPGCGEAPPPPPVECPDGDLNGEAPGCGTDVGGVGGGGENEVGGIVEETRVEHRFRCGQAIRIERKYEDGKLVDTDRTVTPTGEDCSPAELRIPAEKWERSHVEETGL